VLAKIELSTELTEIPEPIAVTNRRTPGVPGCLTRQAVNSHSGEVLNIRGVDMQG
jgi:hypothetical protein